MTEDRGRKTALELAMAQERQRRVNALAEKLFVEFATGGSDWNDDIGQAFQGAELFVAEAERRWEEAGR